ncbi:MAG TPA: T9SS type A sorting domain-containing protein, partial [Saprospiraceae bacterium]|nr:T9SS type A sorting domain-containing protein [Saprospiraceae bacterium]
SNDKWVNDQYYDISAKIPGGKPNGSWVTPYMIDPNNSSTLVAGYNDVYRTTNKGESWSQISTNLTGSTDNTLDCIQVAPSDSKIIFCSRGNTLYKTINLGANWNTLSVPDNESISSITINPTNANIIWLTRSGYSGGQKVYKSINGGTNWTNISGTLPNVPANCMIYEIGSNDALYLGTDIGVFYRSNTLSDWVPYTLGLPNTVTTDLKIQYQKKIIRAATFGRGIWESSLAQPEPITANLILDNIQLNDTDSLVVCIGQSLQFDPQTTKNGKWVWTGPNSFSSLIRNPQLIITTGNEGIYTVNFTDKYGITTITNYKLKVINKPTISISAEDSTVCFGQIAKLSASGFNTIQWLPVNIINNQLQVTADTVTSFSAVAFVNAGCIDTALFNLTIYPKTELKLIQDKQQICVLDSVRLIAQGMLSYNWTYPGGTSTSDSIVLHPDHDFNISLEGVDINACKDTVYTSINLFPKPDIHIFASSLEICLGDSLTLSSSLNGQYVWSTSDTTISVWIKPTTNQQYFLNYTDENTCKASDTISILVHNIPAKPVLFQDLNTIKSNTLASNYAWYFKNKLIQSGLANSINADTTGLYTLTITDEFGCTSSESLFFILTSNIELTQKIGLSISPNPNKGLFTINFHLDNIQNCELLILDESGKSIYRNLGSNLKGKISENIKLSNLAKAQYHLCLYLSEGVVCKAFIVE